MKNTLKTLAVGAIALTLAACGGATQTPTTPADPADPGTTGAADTNSPTAEQPPPGEIKKVTYLTSFGSFGRDAYAYIAKEKGFFDEEGLDVTIEPGAGTVEVAKLVASGQAQFGAADFPTVAITVANEGLPVKAVTMVQQNSLAAVITLEKNSIAEPKDLEGKKIADAPGSTNQVIFPVYAKAAGFDASTVEFVPSPPPGLTQLLVSGQVDAVGNFVLVQPLIEAAADGEKARVFPYRDSLPDLYGISIIASDDTINNDPDLVDRFVRAINKGIEYSIENPEESADEIVKVNPSSSHEVAVEEVNIMEPYITADGSMEIGDMDTARVETVIEILDDAGVLNKDLTAAELIWEG